MKVVSYSDDTTILAQSENHILEPVYEVMNAYLDELASWFDSRKLQISAAKSSATIFTTAGQEVGKQLQVKVKEAEVPTIGNPKILGVVYDGQMTSATTPST